MGFFDFLFGTDKKQQVQEMMSKGAIILDVRTKREWDNGHIANAKHVPLDDLQNQVEKLKKLNKPIITCCASGMRSAKAAQILKSKNIESINGGSWLSLKKKL
ncbi:rhodanese-related sulfurtransferase [Gelidibacter sediminis]|mgnify:CR=1 FL=1|uniref:Rhodanese-like domain-containing protein n=2 Tax=Gelidibacter TaxID=49279 RepID=A0A5C7AM42_9FLAO|nr:MULTISPECIES: rhodanese-like domain-containing protein [Gelidibacter]MCK0122820.1 rhodanese-like domain-containing protein [Gelidibacter sp. F2691]TDU43908.1 rhodanese-related sulfurtransferase [Gelidibacter sediminis]TXE06862.1 rhodanese-like domain-containing protein [Gelidibacter salicanalis]